jgi:hypothetical protein
MASQVVAGDGVQHTAAEEGGAYQDVDDIEHDDLSPPSNRATACGKACYVARKLTPAPYIFDRDWGASAYRFHIDARASVRTSTPRPCLALQL